jgi:predicted membrane protein
MSIILGIIGIIIAIWLFFFLIGLVVTIIKYLFVALVFILKWTLILMIPVVVIILFVYLFTLIGLWSIALFITLLFIIWLIKRLGPESLEKRVTNVFHEYEMASIEDLLTQVSGAPSVESIIEVLDKLIEQGKVELMEFDVEDSVLFRWTERRKYPKGVITTHLNVD